MWPIHERDADGDAGRSLSGLYLGAAGVIWALHELGSQRDFAEVADGLDRRFLDEPDFEPEKGEAAPGLWLGRSGILAVAERLSPSPVRRDLLLDVLEQNIGNPTVEVMWGAPGSLLVAAEMLDRTGDPRWADLWSRLADDVWSGWVEDERWGYRIWTQLLYGTVAQYISPAHGFAGNVAALAGRPQLLGPERTAELEREAVRTSTATAVIDGDLANWQPLAGETLDGSPGRVRAIRTQWCHGAPGQVATLACIAPHDAEYTRLLVAGGELTWRAGPLRKGPGLCHGTAGNGLRVPGAAPAHGRSAVAGEGAGVCDALHRAGRGRTGAIRAWMALAVDRRSRRRVVPAQLHRPRGKDRDRHRLLVKPRIQPSKLSPPGGSRGRRRGSGSGPRSSAPDP